MKKLLRAKALRLRSLGYSMGEISDRLHISQSTAYLWVKNVQLSAGAQKRLLDRGAEGRAKGVLTNRKKRQALLKKIQKDQKSILQGIRNR
jgi:orotate phosphoribosyltransferase-like protein